MLQKHFPYNSNEILAAVDFRMPGIVNILPLILRIKLASRYFTHFMRGGWGVGFLKKLAIGNRFWKGREDWVTTNTKHLS